MNVVSADAPASSVTIVSQSPPPAKPAGKKYEGGSSAEEVARLLRDEANVIEVKKYVRECNYRRNKQRFNRTSNR